MPVSNRESTLISLSRFNEVTVKFLFVPVIRPKEKEKLRVFKEFVTVWRTDKCMIGSCQNKQPRCDGVESHSHADGHFLSLHQLLLPLCLFARLRSSHNNLL